LYRVPSGWAQDLDGLPGFDRRAGTVRLANDPERLRDTEGRDLLYPGRCHPLTRRAIASVRSGRVSAARDDTLSLLVTYSVEVGSLLRDVFALCLFPDGSVVEKPLWWPDDAVTENDSWDRHFAVWAPDAITAAGSVASVIADRIAAECTVEYQNRVGRDVAVARDWLGRRADELCGAVAPRMEICLTPHRCSATGVAVRIRSSGCRGSRPIRRSFLRNVARPRTR
jgi:hypothetical protein